MKNRSLSVSIKEPCHEKWSEMTSVEQGRYCQSCQQDVIDFTKMHKAGIAEYMSANTGSLCGRFTKDQLDVNLLPAKKNRLFMKWAAVFLGMVPFAGYGQQTQTTDKIEQIIMGERMTVNHLKAQPSKTKTISGKVVDSAGESIPFATLASYDQKGNLISGVDSDLDGNFTIKFVSDGYFEVSYIGYRNERHEFNSLIYQNSKLVIKLLYESYLLGDVEIVEYAMTGLTTVMGSTSTVSSSVGMVFVDKESWLQRQLKSLKKLVVRSHSEAVKNRRLDKDNATLEFAEQELGGEKEVILESTPKTDVSIKFIKSVYPNPTSGITTIELNQVVNNSQIYVTDENNQLINLQQVDGLQIDLDLSHYPSGTYIISLIKEENLLGSELIIKI